MSLPEQSKQGGGDSEDIQEFFWRKSPWTDIRLDVEGKTLYVSKSFLTTISPVFRLMFESDFKEKNVDVLPLPGKKYEDVLAFLQCVDPGSIQEVNYANIHVVLPLAHEYQTQRLLEHCKMCLHNELLSVPYDKFDKNLRDVDTTLMVMRCCEICILAENYNLENLLKTLVTVFTRINAKWYKNVPMFKKISTELRNRIFCSRLGTIEGQMSGAESVSQPRTLKLFGSAANDFLKTSPGTDIQLDVEGKSLYVSKSFLATISPVFLQMLESDVKEKNVDVLSLPGKKYEDVLKFLQCANQGVLQTVKYADIRGVLPLAHEYQVKGLLEKCKKCLLTELLSVSMDKFDSTRRDPDTNLKILSLCEICSLAEEYCFEDLLEICMERFANINIKWYMNVPMFQKISTKLRNRIFCNRLVVVEKAVK